MSWSFSCPVCFDFQSRIIDSRSIDDGGSIRRRRQCVECGAKWSTSEELIPGTARDGDGKKVEEDGDGS